MYSVRVMATNAFKSWHQETPAGLQAAIEEANMRTHGFGYAHIVTDNHGYKLHTALPVDVANKLEAQRAAKRWEWVISLIGAVCLAVVICARR